MDAHVGRELHPREDVVERSKVLFQATLGSFGKRAYSSKLDPLRMTILQYNLLEVKPEIQMPFKKGHRIWLHFSSYTFLTTKEKSKSWKYFKVWGGPKE